MMRAVIALLVMTCSAQAAEVGIASTFYDRVIACAPHRINPYKTWGIAHKTLPCGTLVSITQGRLTVIAPVVDLGPCTSQECRAGTTPAYRRARKRLIDLLPMVAKALRSGGLAKVSVAVVN